MNLSDSFEVLYAIKEKDLETEQTQSSSKLLLTSRIFTLMEIPATSLMQHLLKKDEVSVGVIVNINHASRIQKNTQVRIVATFKEIRDKVYVFDVQIFDKRVLISSGTHSRTIILKEELTKKRITQ